MREAGGFDATGSVVKEINLSSAFHNSQSLNRTEPKLTAPTYKTRSRHAWRPSASPPKKHFVK